MCTYRQTSRQASNRQKSMKPAAESSVQDTGPREFWERAWGMSEVWLPWDHCAFSSQWKAEWSDHWSYQLWARAARPLWGCPWLCVEAVGLALVKPFYELLLNLIQEVVHPEPGWFGNVLGGVGKSSPVWRSSCWKGGTLTLTKTTVCCYNPVFSAHWDHRLNPTVERQVHLE